MGAGGGGGGDRALELPLPQRLQPGDRSGLLRDWKLARGGAWNLRKGWGSCLWWVPCLVGG